MNKKILSLVLALVMVLGTFTSVFAETKTEAKKEEAKVEKIEKVVGKQNKIDYIRDKKIVEGDEKGNLNLDSNVKRSEITKVLVIANGEEEAAKNLQGVGGVYKDLKADHWANGYIVAGTTRSSKVNDVKMLNGYPDDTFKPENDVTYAELAKMLVVLAKKDLTVEMANNAVWYRDWINWANELGIFADVTVTDYNKAANRADTFTMLYNALYTMKEFKRVPSNETRGIISNLTKDVLQLNQDSKAEYKVTADTVFVTGNTERKQIVELSKLSSSQLDKYYLGSLVRVLVNDKNEVTHIIELGNPAELAANNNFADFTKDNGVWRGVADNTVETSFTKGNTLAKNGIKQEDIKGVYATIQLNSDNTKGKSITFNKVYNDKHDLKLAINDKTEIYVANPANNIMKKVANVNEALSLIGFHNYDGYKIPNVYAGFDSDGAHHLAYKAINANGAKHTAKVIVFNIVSKEFGGEKFRVIESSSSRFGTTLEKTDGTLVERDNVRDTSRFPLEYGDKFDIISLDNVRNASNLKTLLDHSDYRKYPVVEIVEKNNYSIVVKDVNGDRAYIDTRDADIFSDLRFDKFEVGAKIQFALESKSSTVAELISILDRDAKLEGSIVNVVDEVIRHNQQAGTLIKVNEDPNHPTITVEAKYNIFDTRDGNGRAVYNVTAQDANTLKGYEGQYIEFKVEDQAGWSGKHLAFDFAQRGELIKGKATPVQGYQLLVLHELMAPEKVTVENLKAAKDQIKLIDAAWNELNFVEQSQVDGIYTNRVNAVKEKVEKVDVLAKEFANLSNTDFKDISNASLTPADIETAVKAVVDGKIDTTKATSTVEVKAPKTAPNYAKGEALTIKVTLTNAADTTVKDAKTYTGNVAK